KVDWEAVEPALFGTLFERSLDPKKRGQLGAQYTSREDIMLVVEPVLMAPLRREWDRVRGEVEVLVADNELPADPGARTRAVNRIEREVQEKLERFAGKIRSTRVLDPACGSGNFLYVSLALLLDLEKEVSVFAGRYGRGPFFPEVGPHQVLGMELDPYAHELAGVSVWIGYLQWLERSGYGSPPDPVLGPMTNILEMDAVLTHDGDGRPTEPEWPRADVIVGNPPFLGDKRMRAGLGGSYVDDLRKLYKGRVPGGADLVTYWFEKARAEIESGAVSRAGLISTNGVRFGANRRVLERVKQSGDIFMARPDRSWVQDGAAVRVSMVGFDDGSWKDRTLDGLPVEEIFSDLTSRLDVTRAVELEENAGVCFLGMMKSGPFDLTHERARVMLDAPMNPNGRPNSDVVRRRLAGKDAARRPGEGWIVDFVMMEEDEASLYELPFEHIRTHVKPLRDTNKEARQRRYWWRHARPRPALRAAIEGLKRCVVTPEVSKHRVFSFMDTSVVPDHKVHVFARDDDYFFGVLHSRAHESWSLAQGNWMGKGNDPSYSSSRTFPMPWPLGAEPVEDSGASAIARAAKSLDEFRTRWLDPPDTTPTERGNRTLTTLYNNPPAWLSNAHANLDRAVFAAYDWTEDPDELPDEEILKRLLALNLERAAKGEAP
ncbi:MAG: class I SAM-dependent DNA methyltransferase, partial [Actinomycetota bacterium]|nr:class I SAM-dependent DNA methyltransferase [Actinomycetota bacterium]